MAAADSGDILKVTASMSLTGSEMLNVYALKFVSVAGGASATQVGVLVRAYMHDLYNIIQQDMTNTTIWVDLSVKNLTQDTDVGTYAWNSAWTVAGSVGDILPPACSPVITFPTTRGKTRGRKFFPGYTELAVIANSTLGGSPLTRLVNAGAFLLVAQGAVIAGMTLQYVVVSQGVGAFVTYNPTAANVSTIIGYQTRRKQGRGR